MVGFVCEVTPRCNLSCAFCYNPWRATCSDGSAKTDIIPNGVLEAQVAHETHDELPLAAWTKILDEVMELEDLRWLTFTGGEPLLYRELESLVRWARQRAPHATLGLATNGTLLTGERLSSLVDAGIGHVELPLLTLERDRYAELTGVDGGEKHLRKAIAAASLAPVSLTLAITLLPEERSDLEATLELAHAFGADRIALNRFVPTGAGTAWCAGAGVHELDQLGEQLARAQAFASSRSMVLDVTIPVEDCLFPHDCYPSLRFHPCVCGAAKWAIDPMGRLRTCEQSSEFLGDLRIDGISDVIKNEQVAAFLQDNRSDECTTCSKWERCGGGCRFVDRFRGPSDVDPTRHLNRLTARGSF